MIKWYSANKSMFWLGVITLYAFVSVTNFMYGLVVWLAFMMFVSWCKSVAEGSKKEEQIQALKEALEEALRDEQSKKKPARTYKVKGDNK